MIQLASDNDAYRFSVDHAWARLPADRSWGTTHGVAIDSQGQVHVLHTGPAGREDGRVEVFAPDGSWLRSWGAPFSDGAHGIAIVDLQGTEVALVTDQRLGLFCCALDGTVHWQLSKPSFYRQRPHLNWSPANCAVDEGGHIHLGDGYGSYFIIIIDAEGREVDLYGGPGLHDGALLAPHGLGLVDDGNGGQCMMVVENKEPALHLFDQAGHHRQRRRHPALIAPRHVRPHGDLLLIPDLAGRLGLWSPGATSEPIAMLGSSPYDFAGMFAHRDDRPEDMPAGAFVAPHDAVTATDGSIYVVEWVTQGRVSKLTPLR